jgi:hypothetical protein
MAMQKINIEQAQNSLRLVQAKIELWEQKIATFKLRMTKERAFITALAYYFPPVGSGEWPSELQKAANVYVNAHKSHSEAEEQLMQLQVAEFKAQAAILEAGLKEADSSIILGGSAGLVSQ